MNINTTKLTNLMIGFSEKVKFGKKPTTKAINKTVQTKKKTIEIIIAKPLTTPN